VNRAAVVLWVNRHDAGINSLTCRSGATATSAAAAAAASGANWRREKNAPWRQQAVCPSVRLAARSSWPRPHAGAQTENRTACMGL